MTDLTIPADADAAEARALIQDNIQVGETVKVRNAERTEDHQIDVTAEVTSFEPEYIEIDDQPLGEGSVRYDDIQTIAKVESG